MEWKLVLSEKHKMIYFWKSIILLSISCGRAEPVAQQVKGIVGESVTLTVEIPNLQPDTEIDWRYGSEKTDWLIARVQRGRIEVYEDRYKARLQTDNTTSALQISRLEKEDSGHYIVEVYRKIKFQKIFLLSIYDAVPIPQVNRSSEARDNDYCILLCSVTESNNVLLSWQRNWTEVTQPSSTSTTRLQLSNYELQGENSTNTYACVASNPVHNHTVTFTPSDYCPSTAIKDSVSSWLSTELIVRVLLFTLLTAALITVCVWLYRNWNNLTTHGYWRYTVELPVKHGGAL
ncbi:CD48 antigen-like isoform X1 [Acipenser ruthenus]|uniref:CD48 antigen-like isoform X1 n=1 Tax=Acipenser ruthenus TaxID=7906 RepID=UPI00145AEC44|nr:CD48 antigen-like isoform X1 [Acipenser ruthenus]